MKTLRARVSPRLLQNSPLLFNQSPQGVLLELLQNCRRAQATKIEIQTSEETPEKTRVSLSDNGTGIKNPDHLLHLGHTGWNEDLQLQESPAGMGFFSLCHLSDGVQIHSLNWKLHIPPEAFQGKTPCQPTETVTRQGTQLEFSLPLKQEKVNQILKELGKHFPVAIKINGKDLPQFPFLKDALFIAEYTGGAIGVYNKEKNFQTQEPNINFHGHKVHWKLTPTPWEHTTRVDAHSNDLLDLVLPARQTLVENQKLEELQKLCRKAVYSFLEKSRQAHRLSFSFYQEAQSFGVHLHEAQAELLPASPQPIHNHQDKYWNHTQGKLSPKEIWKPQTVTAQDYLSLLSRAELAALHLSGGDFPPLFLPKSDMEGYSWYPKNLATEVRQIIQFENPIAGKPIETQLTVDEPDDEDSHALWELNNENNKNHPSGIFVELSLQEPPLPPQKTRYPTFIAFRGDLNNEEGIESGWIPKNGKIDQIDTELLKTLFLNPSEDWEADSYETQVENFQEYAQEKITTCSAGRNQAVLDQLENKINTWEIKRLLKELSTTQVTLVQKNGQWTIEPTQEKNPS
jgi:hypothetical protein